MISLRCPPAAYRYPPNPAWSLHLCCPPSTRQHLQTPIQSINDNGGNPGRGWTLLRRPNIHVSDVSHVSLSIVSLSLLNLRGQQLRSSPHPQNNSTSTSIWLFSALLPVSVSLSCLVAVEDTFNHLAVGRQVHLHSLQPLGNHSPSVRALLSLDLYHLRRKVLRGGK